VPPPAALFDPHLGELSGWVVYAVVWGFTFVESGLLVGFFLPGDTILFGAGLLAGAPDSPLNVALLAGGAFVAAVAGDQLGYALGRRLGRPWLERRARPSWWPHIRRTEEFYRRYGPLAVIVARYIPWVRTFIPFVAGAARMPYLPFLAANIVGALCWAVGITLVGARAATVPGIKDVAYAVAAAVVLASMVIMAAGWWRSRRADAAAAAEPPDTRAEDGPR
jgi:membrane-associated protein